MDKRYIVALEFSGSQVKGAAAVVNSTPYAPMATPLVHAIAHEDKSDCVQYGRVQNIIDAHSHASFVLQKLENNPALIGGKTCAAYVALGGRSLGSLRTTAQLSLPTQMEIDNDVMNKLISEATKTVGADKLVIKVLPRKFWVDNQPCQNPIGALGSTFRGEFTVVTCNPANRNNIKLVVDERLNIPVVEYVPTPLALADLALAQEEKQLGCMLVDMGSQTTTVAIYKDRALQHLATLPLGSQHITHDIAIGLSLTDERAEQAKRTQGNATADQTAGNPEIGRLNCYLQARLGEIIANVLFQATNSGFKPSDLPAGIVLTGRGAKLSNIIPAIEAQTKMKVRRATVGTAVNVADSEIQPNDYLSIISIIAYAAAQPLGQNCMQFPDMEAEKSTVSDEMHTQGTPFVFNDDDADENWDEDEDAHEQKKNKHKSIFGNKDKKKNRNTQPQRPPQDDTDNDVVETPKENIFDKLRRKVRVLVTPPPDVEDGSDDIDLDAKV